ncbi:MAG: ABC transporter permease [Anaerolineales bacterium]|nr:ABC transporter permease [Anaerolineales bacterium]
MAGSITPFDSHLSSRSNRIFRTQSWMVIRSLFRTPMAVIGFILVMAWIVIALTIPAWSPYAPLKQDVTHRLIPPSQQHLFGTDYLGRDVLSRVLYGSRVSLPVALIVASASLVVGGIIGAIGGYFRGILDDILMRLADVTLAFPSILLAMAIVTVSGPGLRNAMLAMLIVGWPRYARLMRAQVLGIKEMDYVSAARSLGAKESRILTYHVVPMCTGPLVVAVTLDLGSVLLLAAALSFIGLGAVPPQPEWGLMVAEGRSKFLQWWISGFPGLAIMSLVLGFNFIGDAIRDALDPVFRSKQG